MSRNVKSVLLRKNKKSLKDHCNSSLKFCCDRLTKFTSGSRIQIFLALFDLYEYLFLLFGDILYMICQD